MRPVRVLPGVVDRCVSVAEVPAVDVVGEAVPVVVEAVPRDLAGVRPCGACEVRVAEIDAVVDDRDDDRWIALRDPQRLEAVDVDVGDAGLVLCAIEVLAGVVEAPLARETRLGSGIGGELAAVVGGHREDARVGVEAAPDGGCGQAVADDDLGSPVLAGRHDVQAEIARDGAALGESRVCAVAHDDLIRRRGRGGRVCCGHAGRGDQAGGEGDRNQDRLTGCAHRRPSYAGRSCERDSLDVTGGS